MALTTSQVRSSEDRLLAMGASGGWAETCLHDLEVKVAEQEAQIAVLRRQVYLDEEEAEREVALLLDEGGEGEEEGLSKGIQVMS
jgi:hypothetical protein